MNKKKVFDTLHNVTRILLLFFVLISDVVLLSYCLNNHRNPVEGYKTLKDEYRASIESYLDDDAQTAFIPNDASLYIDESSIVVKDNNSSAKLTCKLGSNGEENVYKWSFFIFDKTKLVLLLIVNILIVTLYARTMYLIKKSIFGDSYEEYDEDYDDDYYEDDDDYYDSCYESVNNVTDANETSNNNVTDANEASNDNVTNANKVSNDSITDANEASNDGATDATNDATQSVSQTVSDDVTQSDSSESDTPIYYYKKKNIFHRIKNYFNHSKKHHHHKPKNYSYEFYFPYRDYVADEDDPFGSNPCLNCQANNCDDCKHVRRLYHIESTNIIDRIKISIYNLIYGFKREKYSQEAITKIRQKRDYNYYRY